MYPPLASPNRLVNQKYKQIDDDIPNNVLFTFYNTNDHTAKTAAEWRISLTEGKFIPYFLLGLTLQSDHYSPV